MASISSASRPASINDRRASIAHRNQQSRADNGTSEDSSRHRKTTSATESRTKSEHASMLRRTKMTIQSDESSRRPTTHQTTKSPDFVENKAKPEPAWHPTATLLSVTSTNAPLACRLSVPPQSKHAPVSLQAPSIASLTLEQQENAMIDDLLFVMLGLEGQYIVFDTERQPYDPFNEKSRLAGPMFSIARGLDPSLRDLTQQMLKTASHVAALDAFIEVMSRYQYGSVSHAFCAAMRSMHKDFLLLIAQLENQYLTKDDFSLQQMSLHLRKSTHLMALLFSLTQEILAENGLGGSVDENLPEDDDDDEFENVLASIKEGGSSRAKKSCIGGALLTLLTRRLHTLSGDPHAKEVFSTLLKQASIPYTRMLNEWLHHGNVKDSHQEFMVKEAKSIRREILEQDYTDEYWEKRYTIRKELVPPQLSTVAERVLLAGKYLNVVRECSSSDSSNAADAEQSIAVPQDFTDQDLLPSINAAYHHANAALMEFLLSTHHLAQRLKSFKHYFFLDRSDWFTYFLELAHSELRKHAKAANPAKLQSLLDLVLHTPGSVAAEDPFKEDVRISISDAALTGWLMQIVNVQGMDVDATALTNSYNTGADRAQGEDDIRVHQVLTLDASVPFPLSLIISRVTLTRYQLLFRYLLSLKFLEHQLIVSWSEAGGIGSVSRRPETKSHAYSDLNAWKRRNINSKVELWKRRAWCLRSRMLTFVQQLLYFCTAEVIDPNWKAFMARLSSSTEPSKTTENSMQSGPSTKRTVDELMQDHVDFLATCLKECMLTNSKLLRINSKVTSTCAHFANYTSSFSRSLDRIAPANASSVNEDELNKLFNILNQYEQHFSRHLKILLDALNYLAATETVGFLGLCARLSMAAEGGPGGRPSPSALENNVF